MVSRAPASGARSSAIESGDLAERRPNGVDPGQIACHQRVVARHLGANPVGALDVDDAAIDEPGECVVEGRELVHRETIFGVIGVQEVEGVLQVDVMGVTAVDRVGNACACSLDNHSIPIDRLRARG